MRRSWLFVLLLTILILLLTACPEKQDLLGTLTMLEPVGQGIVEPEVGEHSFVKTVSVDLKAEPAEGWQFDKWLIDEEEIFEAETTVIIEGDIDSVAHFIEIPTAEYTLTLDKEGEGTALVDGTEAALPFGKDFEEGTELTLKAEPAEGWQFDKWVVDGEDVLDAETVVTMDADVDAVAHFSEIPPTEYTLTVDKEGEGTSIVNGTEVALPFDKDYEEGTEIALKAEPAEGWQFDSWLIDEKEIFEAETTVIIEGDIDAVAYFIDIPPAKYSLTMLEPVGEGEVTPEPGVYTHVEDEKVTLLAEATDGWTFEKWIVNDEEFFMEELVLNMNEDKTVQAFFVEIPPARYTITFVYPGPGTGYATRHPAAPTYKEGDEVLLTAFPNRCALFKNWGGDASGTFFQTTITMDSDKTVYVFFDEKKTPPTIEIDPVPHERTNAFEKEVMVYFSSAYDDVDLLDLDQGHPEEINGVSFSWDLDAFDGPTGEAELTISFGDTDSPIDCDTITFTIYIEDACGNVGEEEVTIIVDNWSPRSTLTVEDKEGDDLDPYFSKSETSSPSWRDEYPDPDADPQPDDIYNAVDEATISWEVEENCLMTLRDYFDGTLPDTLDPDDLDTEGALLLVAGYQGILSSDGIVFDLTNDGNNTESFSLQGVLENTTNGFNILNEIEDQRHFAFFFVEKIGSLELNLEDMDALKLSVELFAFDKTGNNSSEIRRYIIDNVVPQFDNEEGFVVGDFTFCSNNGAPGVQNDTGKDMYIQAEISWKLTDGSFKEIDIVPSHGKIEADDNTTNSRALVESDDDVFTSSETEGSALWIIRLAELSYNNSFASLDTNENDNKLVIGITASDKAGNEAFIRKPISLNALTVAANPEEGGTSSPDSGTYYLPEDLDVTVEAIHNEGWRFVNWTSDSGVTFGNPNDPETTLSMPDTDVTVTANFEMIDYTVGLTANPDEGGVVEGEGSFNYEDEVTITADPKTGWEFVNWTDDNDGSAEVSAEEVYTFSMPAGDVNYTASFERVYTLTLEAEPTSGGEAIDVTGAGSYAEGEEVSIKAEANEGWRFRVWTGDTDYINYHGSFKATVTMPARDVSFTANFGDLTLYDGKTYNHIWVSGYSAGGANSSVYKSDDYLRLYATDGAEATWVTDNAVDLTGIRYVSIEWMNNGVTDETNNSFLVVSKSKTSNHNTYDRRLERTGQFGEEENLTKDSLNVSALDGIYYIRIHSYSAEYFSRIRVYRVYLE